MSKNQRWQLIGTYTSPERTAQLAMQPQPDNADRWSARWLSADGSEQIHGPGTLDELLAQYVAAGFNEPQLLVLLASAKSPEVREFAQRRFAIRSLSKQDKLALQLMRYWKPNRHVRLEASWCYDDAIARIRIRPEDWLEIAGGDWVDLQGQNYSYEGSRYRTVWSFNRCQRGEVTVSYWALRSDGDSGDGYEGSIEDLIISPRYL